MPLRARKDGMAWTYLDWNEVEGRIDEKLPAPGTAYLAFDTIRASVVIGYRERGGYSSCLTPNVDDDCDVAAWAPLDEPTDPDLTLITGWDGKASAVDPGAPILARHNSELNGCRRQSD
jgi:hypothetical protein